MNENELKSAAEWVRDDRGLFDDETDLAEQAAFVRAIQANVAEAAAQQAERILNSDGAMIAKWIRALKPSGTP